MPPRRQTFTPKRHGFTPNIIYQCSDTSVAMIMVQQKMGISYQPRSIVKTLNLKDVYCKPIKGFEMKTYPALIWNDNIYLSRSVKLFLSLYNMKALSSSLKEELAESAAKK